ncbi:MAG: tRNA (N6-threonylcarbamoyladenosine(37)-N6)-methyltransferase TrmO [Methanoculleus sp.]|nr:tRNA (N6-threonylcarbamoyladenosine(37)-N6)-methyltransferase TrmO [Methanoculleus sp.]
MQTQSPGPGGMILRPVGFVRNTVQEPFLVAGRDGISTREGPAASRDHVRSVKEAVSDIVIDENRIALLDGIEDYSHITVLYWGHKVPEESRSVDRVHPMGRTDIPLKGIFSTCSPARPNPVLATIVALHTRRGNVLEVTGLDAVDGSPVIDIKPYVPAQYPKGGVRIPAWMDGLMKEVNDRQA